MDAQETRLFFIVLLAVTLIGVIIYAFFASLRRQHQRILQLKLQNMTAELNSMERERARIATDLHDELSPMLSAVKLKVSSFELHNREDQVQQQKTDDHLSDVLQRLRTISFNLMPVTLQRKGLAAALQEFTGYVSRQDGLQIRLHADPVVLDDEQSIHLYRIVQEIVHNTVKHAKASLLTIELRAERDRFVLATRDNGCGFSYEDRLTQGVGFGLRNLLSRTDVLGGELLVDAQTGEGTAYLLQIPRQP